MVDISNEYRQNRSVFTSKAREWTSRYAKNPLPGNTSGCRDEGTCEASASATSNTDILHGCNRVSPARSAQTSEGEGNELCDVTLHDTGSQIAKGWGGGGGGGGKGGGGGGGGGGKGGGKGGGRGGGEGEGGHCIASHDSDCLVVSGGRPKERRLEKSRDRHKSRSKERGVKRKRIDEDDVEILCIDD